MKTTASVLTLLHVYIYMLISVYIYRERERENRLGNKCSPCTRMAGHPLVWQRQEALSGTWGFEGPRVWLLASLLSMSFSVPKLRIANSTSFLFAGW